MFGTVNRDAYKYIIVSKKVTPIIIQSCPVCLESIFDPFSPGIFLLELYGISEKIEPHKCRFASLPGKSDNGYLISFDKLFCEVLEQFVSHSECIAGEQFLLLEIIAVSAVKVTGRSGRLQHDMKSIGPFQFQGISKEKISFHTDNIAGKSNNIEWKYNEMRAGLLRYHLR